MDLDRGYRLVVRRYREPSRRNEGLQGDRRLEQCVYEVRQVLGADGRQLPDPRPVAGAWLGNMGERSAAAGHATKRRGAAGRLARNDFKRGVRVLEDLDLVSACRDTALAVSGTDRNADTRGSGKPCRLWRYVHVLSRRPRISGELDVYAGAGEGACGLVDTRGQLSERYRGAPLGYADE